MGVGDLEPTPTLDQGLVKWTWKKVDFAYEDDDGVLTLTFKLHLQTKLRDIEFFY